MRRTICGGHI